MTVTPDPVPRWSRELAKLRAQTGRASGDVASRNGDVAEAALQTCESVLRDLAAAQLEVERLQAKVQVEVAVWERLFEVMPRACVITDSGGFIVDANSAAGALLNVSARHLKNRQLLVFTRDREAFRVLLERISRRAEEQVHGSLSIRPRERRALDLDVRIVPLSEGSGMWLWFFLPPGTAAQEPELDAAVVQAEQFEHLHASE